MSKPEQLLTGNVTTTYGDFFMRPNLATPYGQVPALPPLMTSPDIIPQTAPLANFQTALATSTSYGQDIGKNLNLGQNNLIYVRAKNAHSGAQSGTIALYYAPSAVINWPSQWVNNKLKTDQGNISTTISATAMGAISVGANPFQWVPQTPPAGSDHYCLFSQIMTPTTPNPIPGQNVPMTYENMATLVATDLGIAWRNVTLVENSLPTWNYQTMLTVPSSTPTAEVVHVYLACNNIPVGGTIQFTCSSTDKTSGPISIPPTPITDPNQISGVTVTLQPGFSGSITVSYWSNGKTPVSGANILLEASLEAGGYPKLQRLVRPNFRARFAKANITPTLPIYLGNFLYHIVSQ
ncbi:MAG TPA: hypothetical protein VGZ00_09860 [Candidatus Baltobacteraceae bacterium]|jgi:hypothetical protein|nr:hypothetical protein [Candidatus Baltobacteraceae bacterium]